MSDDAQAPAIGDIVLYQRPDTQETLPAMVWKVYSPTSVALTIFGAGAGGSPDPKERGDGLDQWQPRPEHRD